MAQVIDLLERDAERLKGLQHPLLGSATLNIGLIRGGVQVNFVPDQCVIELDRRLLPGETWEQVFDYYDRLLESLRHGELAQSIILHPPMLTDLPLDCDPQQSVIQQLVRLLDSMQLDCGPMGVPFGSDASKLPPSVFPASF